MISLDVWSGNRVGFVWETLLRESLPGFGDQPHATRLADGARTGHGAGFATRAERLDRLEIAPAHEVAQHGFQERLTDVELLC